MSEDGFQNSFSHNSYFIFYFIIAQEESQEICVAFCFDYGSEHNT